MNPWQYYNSKIIQRRIIEFLGCSDNTDLGAVFISSSRNATHENFIQSRPNNLNYFFEHEKDFSRSLWDKKYFVFDLDVEYINFDFPAEPYLDRFRSLSIQQPLVADIRKELSSYGIEPLDYITGRGHHFVWQIDKNDSVFERLSQIGIITAELESKYRYQSELFGQKIDTRLGKAFAGAGLLMEYIANKIKKESAYRIEIPINVTDVTVVPQNKGREIISLDISEYADPLQTRIIRIPFCVYSKPYCKPGVYNNIQNQVPLMIVIPQDGLDIEQAVAISGDFAKVEQYAYRCKTKIPIFSSELDRLIDSYKKSELFRFHQYFYSQQHDPTEHWPQTYDKTDITSLPACIRHILQNPNPLLLTPSAIRMVVSVLMNRGWHPRHIAGLIRSKYERNFGWLNEWYVYDAPTRADFYTRVFAGLMHTKADTLEDVNCNNIHPDLHCNI